MMGIGSPADDGGHGSTGRSIHSGRRVAWSGSDRTITTAATGPIQTLHVFSIFSMFSARFQQLLKMRRRQICRLIAENLTDILLK